MNKTKKIREKLRGIIKQGTKEEFLFASEDGDNVKVTMNCSPQFLGLVLEVIISHLDKPEHNIMDFIEEIYKEVKANKNNIDVKNLE